MTRRPVWLLWVGIGLILALSGGLMLAINRWPESVVPHLPIRLLIQVAAWIPPRGDEVLEQRLHRPDAERAVLAVLASDSVARRRVLGVLTGGSLTSGVLERLFELANVADPEVASAARNAIEARQNRGLRWLARQAWDRPLEASSRPFAPDGWRPGPEARRALVLLCFLGAGYDQRQPSQYQKLIALLVAELNAAAGHDLDRRDRAIVLAALAEDDAMTSDAAQRPIVDALFALTRRSSDDVAAWWQHDTTTAMLHLVAWKSCVATGLAVGSVLEDLKRGLDQAGSRVDGLGDWYADGKPLGLPLGLRAGLQACARIYLGERIEGSEPEVMLLDHEELRYDLTTWMWISGTFQMGGDAWESHGLVLQDRIRAERTYAWDGGDAGPWTTGSPGDDLLRTASAVLSLQAYERFPRVIGMTK